MIGLLHYENSNTQNKQRGRQIDMPGVKAVNISGLLV